MYLPSSHRKGGINLPGNARCRTRRCRAQRAWAICRVRAALRSEHGVHPEPAPDRDERRAVTLRPRQPINKRFPLAVRTPIIRGGRHGSALPAIALGGGHGSRAGFAASAADDPHYAADARLWANLSDPTTAFPSWGAASLPRFTASDWIRSYSKHQVSKMAAGGMTSRSALGSTISGEVEARIEGRGSAEGGGVGGGIRADLVVSNCLFFSLPTH